MRKGILFVAVTLAITLSSDLHARQTRAPALLDELVVLERGALDRWIRANPQGYLDLFAADLTYFDPLRDVRLDGIAAMKQMLAGMGSAPSPVTDPRYDMIGARVQRHGDAAILTFNLVSYGKIKGQPESVLTRWNSTEVYGLVDGKWKIVHSHWSYTKPELKP